MIPKNWLEIVRDLRQVSPIRLAFGVDINEIKSDRAQSGSRKETRSLGVLGLQQEPSPPLEKVRSDLCSQRTSGAFLPGACPDSCLHSAADSVTWACTVGALAPEGPACRLDAVKTPLHYPEPHPPKLRNRRNKVMVSYSFFIASDEIGLQIYLENSDFNCD